MHSNQKQMLDIANIVLCKYSNIPLQILFLCKMHVSEYSVQDEEDMTHDSVLRTRIQIHSWLNFISVALSDHNGYQSPVSYIKVKSNHVHEAKNNKNTIYYWKLKKINELCRLPEVPLMWGFSESQNNHLLIFLKPKLKAI